MTESFMFDTNVFNRIFEHEIEEEWFPKDARYFVTHIQRDELAKTPDPNRRMHLMLVLSSVGPSSIATASAMWNVSKFGESEWGSGDGLFQKMLTSLNARNKNKENNGADVLIAETALRNDCRVVTDDTDLAIVVREFQGKTMTLSEFLTRSEK